MINLPYPLGTLAPQQVLSDLEITAKQYPGIVFKPSPAEVGGLQNAVREIAGAQWILVNADYTPNGFQQMNPLSASAALVVFANGMLFTYTAPAGAPTPVVWTMTSVTSSDAQGFFIESFVTPTDGNPALATFDWGPVLTRASNTLSVTGGTILFRSVPYLFVTTATMTGSGVNLIGASQRGTFLTAAGNNDIIGISPSWSNSEVSEIQFLCRQDGVHPTAGAALNLSQAQFMNVHDCRFNGTWYGVFAQGIQSIIMRDCEAANFRKAGFWFAQAAGQGSVLQIKNCGANPANVSGGAALDASGYVFDGNIASITVNGFGGTGNVGDGVSYGDLMRFQNSFGGGSASLIEIYNGTADHWNNYGFNFGNWIGPATAIDTSPGSSGTQIAKITCSNLIATSCNTGLYMDNVGGVQGVNNDMSSNGRAFYYGANASDCIATGWKTDIAGATGLWIQPGFQGLTWDGGQIGKLGTTASGTGVRFAQIVASSPSSNDNIYIHDCPIHATNPVGIGSATNFSTFLGNNTEILDCDGFNPLIGGWSAPGALDPTAAGFPTNNTDVINANPFPVEIVGTLNVAFTFTITPQGIGPEDAAFTSPSMAAGNFSFRVPTWGKFHYTYAGTPTRLHGAIGY